ncbi:MAG: phosphatidylglycerophosphatase A [Candidatus Omnitrophica bacterium]|nr:phosphatidylglycerophosphatase A [Candidatus Omnitrophota bacterium]
MTWWANFNRKYGAVPNALSILRGLVGMCLPLLILSDWEVFHVTAFFLFWLAVMTDYWDGWIARTYGLETRLGKILDPSMDKILILVPLAVFAQQGFYSVWWAVPIFIREIVITFCRVAWLLEGRAIGAERIGKIKFFCQAMVIGFAMFYALTFDFPFLASFTRTVKLLMGILIMASAVLTVVSGFSFMRRNLFHCQSEFFIRFTCALGVGLLPFAPGTWGSLAALPIIFLASFNLVLYLAIFAVITLIGYWSVGKLNLEENRDPRYVVIDEVCGMFVTLMALPMSVPTVLAGFLLFRLFDVLKPFPVRHLERLPGYWGILFDDLGAGFYAWLILYLMAR